MSSNPSAIETLGHNLPVGFTSKGQRFDTFELGPLRGRLRRELAVTNNAYTQKLIALRHAVTKLGNLDSPPSEFLSKLTLQDVDYIMLCLSARELDGKIQIDTKCPEREGGCNGEISVSVDLMKVALLPGNEVQYGEGIVYQDCTIKHPRTGVVENITFRVAALKDLEGTAESFMRAARLSRSGDNTAMSELVNLGLAKDIIKYEGKAVSVDQLENMDLRLYDAIVEVRNRDVDPRHIDGEVEIVCPHCGHKFITGLDVEAWMSPFASRTLSES